MENLYQFAVEDSTEHGRLPSVKRPLLELLNSEASLEMLGLFQLKDFFPDPSTCNVYTFKTDASTVAAAMQARLGTMFYPDGGSKVQDYLEQVSTTIQSKSGIVSNEMHEDFKN